MQAFYIFANDCKICYTNKKYFREATMEFLKLLEGIRTPFLDSLFSLITHLGEETIFIVVGLIFYWCINKKQGYYLFFVGLFGTVVNQFLKLWFRIPRPWVKDPEFTIVESARAEATGYSFPSGHTQSSVGLFGGIAAVRKEKAVKIIMLILCLLVPFSRMYLGVHTPLDVIVSIIVAVVLIFAFKFLTDWAMKKPINMRVLMYSILALCLGFVLFVELYNFPSDIDLYNYEHGLSNGYKMFGTFLGLYISYEIDHKYVNFETSGSLLTQILKVSLGIIPLILIKSFLKAPLLTLCGGHFIADGIRYFLIGIFAGIVWPLTFKFFAKIGKNNG